MTDVSTTQRPPERLVKSADRVRELGEVFTPKQVVVDMLDLIPEDTWAADPPATFLEPACGDGNFLVAILDRKLTRVVADWRAGSLRAGEDDGAFHFHALQALSSVYGMDISADNVLGGVPQHPLGARDRLEGVFTEHVTGATDEVRASARWIVARNVQVADMLPPLPGAPGSRDSVPLISYAWLPDERIVCVSRTTFGDVSASAREQPLALFGPPEPVPMWTGPAERLHLVG